MAGSPPAPPSSTFVVRLWYEATTEGPRWRGRIEHLQSGESTAFLDLDTMLRFLRRFSLEEDEQGSSRGPRTGSRTFSR